MSLLNMVENLMFVDILQINWYKWLYFSEAFKQSLMVDILIGDILEKL
jgi:hypothetical protein